MRHFVSGGLATLFISLCLPSAGFAQQANVQASSTEAPLQEVLITGSRVKRPDGFDYPVPVAVVSGASINDSGFTVLGDALNNLPQALSTTGNQNTSGSLFNAGQSRIDLRGVNSVRTLVLVDGRRHLTGDFRNSSVDLNMIPSTMIDRIEAISGGASAVYGSEAIAGVVNILLKKELNGFVFDLQGGQTSHNDGEEWKGSASYGMKFADDRGSFLVGAEIGKVEPIFQIDRDWGYPGVRRDTTVTPQTVIPASRSNSIPTATFQFVLPMGAAPRSASIALDYSGINRNTAACAAATVLPSCQDPWLFYTATYNVLQGEQERQTARAYLDFKLTDHIKAFGDFTYGRVDGFALFQPAFSNAVGGGTMPVSIRGDNAFLNGAGPLAAQLRTEWTATGLPLTQASSAQIGKFWTEFGRRDSEVLRKSYRAITGIEGGFDAFGRNVTYDAYAMYSELDGFTAASNVPNIQRTQQAADAISVGGQVVCRNVAARAAGCVPWDLVNGPSPEAIAWANGNARADGVASQQILATNFSTELFELPAGPLGFALGAEYRKEKSDQVQDALSASGALFYNAIGQTKGEYDITEGFTEIVVPILKDKPFAYRLSIEGAERVGNYSTVGNISQWRLGAQWAPVQDLRFRGSRSVAVRAPNITDLFGPQARNFTTLGNDPCDAAQINAIAGQADKRANRIANCAAVIPNYDPATFVSNFGTGRSSLALLQGGNPDLEKESADTWTAGFVFTPRWVEGINFSLDYWAIKIDNAVATIPINTLLADLCYDAPAGSPYCNFVERDATGTNGGGKPGGVSQVTLTNQNVQAIDTSGIDLALSVNHGFKRFGAVQFVAEATRLVKWNLQGVPGGAATRFAGVLNGPFVATPRYKASGTLGWTYRKTGVQWQTRYTSPLALSEVDPPSSRDPFFTDNYFEHDVRASYVLSDRIKLRMGVVNVTNEHPPIVPEVGNSTLVTSSVYDNRGRWYYVGGNYTF